VETDHPDVEPREHEEDSEFGYTLSFTKTAISTVLDLIPIGGNGEYDKNDTKTSRLTFNQ
jgi:hypothetical protein